MKALAANLAERGVIDALARRRQASLPTLAEDLAIPPSTAGNVLLRLVNKGLVLRREAAPSGRGRPSFIYSMRLPRPVLSLYFDGTQLATAIIGEDLSILATHSIQVTGIASATVAASMAREAMYALLGQTSLTAADLGEAAVSVNSVITSDGTRSSTVLPWAEQDLVEIFGKRLGLETRVVVVPQSIAEYQLLPDPAPATLVCLNVGDGISGHEIHSGQIATGATGRAGELGHLTVDPKGPPCGCGRRGCLEAMYNGPAIAERVRRLARGKAAPAWARKVADLSPRAILEQLYQAWCDEDTAARSVMADTLDRLGWALGLVYNLIDPHLVVCTGYVLQGRDAWIEEVRRLAMPWILHARRRPLEIVSGRATTPDHLRVIASQHHASQRQPAASATP